MPNETLTRLGKRARQLRKGCNLSQQKVADKSGLALRTVSRIERGLMNPSFEVLSTLASALGTSIKNLLTYPEDDQDADIQELLDLYRTCPKQERRLILASTRALVHELMDEGGKSQ